MAAQKTVTAKPFVGFICGPARGTKAKPYRCICCRVAYEDPEQLGVSICFRCMGGNTACARCRKSGVFLSDFRVGKHVGTGTDADPYRYDPEGGTGHRFRAWRGSLAVMRCGKRIPRAHLGNGEAVVPPCGFCWPRGFGY